MPTDGWSVDRALDNLDAKLAVDDFTSDLDRLVNAAPNGFSVDAAAATARPGDSSSRLTSRPAPVR